MTPRRDLARATYLMDRAIDKLYRPAAPRLAASVRNHASDGQITQEARMLIMRDVDKILSDIGFPKRRGAPSKLQTLIEDRARAVQLLPVAAAVEQMRRVVPDELRKVMGDDV